MSVIVCSLCGQIARSLPQLVLRCYTPDCPARAAQIAEMKEADAQARADRMLATKPVVESAA